MRNSKKIVLFEKTNARYLTSEIIPDKIDLIVCDVSFISLKKVIEPCIKLLKNKFQIISLIKPQFETEKKFVRKGGIIKDKIIHKQVCDDIYSWFDKLLKPDFMKIIDSPIMGQKGNKEFLIYLEAK